MATEIERKFLVDPNNLPADYTTWPSVLIQQGYLSTRPAVRIRITDSGPQAEKKAYITVKGSGFLSRLEYEYEISYEDGLEMLSALCPRVINKRRYKINGWELDEFLDKYSGLWLAEIELSSEEATFSKPDWVFEEVTLDSNFTNSSLAEKGHWPHSSAWARFLTVQEDEEFLTDFLPVNPCGFWKAYVRIQDPLPEGTAPTHVALYDIYRQLVAYHELSCDTRPQPLENYQFYLEYSPGPEDSIKITDVCNDPI